MSTTICNHALAAGCQFDIQSEGDVDTVIDARTFRLTDGREIRLAGLAPAVRNRASETAALAALVSRRHVGLRSGTDAPDRYGRQHAFVTVAGAAATVQSLLLSQGDAVASGTMADSGCAAELAAAEAAARRARRGLWADPAAIKNAESPDDIMARVGRFAIVEGKVISARQAGATFYINFGRRWTRDFAVTISRRLMPSFERAGIHVNSLANRNVRVRGWVERRGGPRIEALDPRQIELIGD
jgi:endonuclease YncB( thermonuclease family)